MHPQYIRGEVMFNKGHYKVIANTILRSSQDNTIDKRLLVDLLCSHFAMDNPRFNEELFRQACDHYTMPKVK